MAEARRHERVRTYLGAQIVFNNKSSTVDCHVRNISSSGAKLVLSETVALPQEFDLRIPQKGRTFRARLRWRSLDSAGVEFLDAAWRDASAPGLDLAARVHELESENELLRKRVRELMAELAKAAESGRIRMAG